MKNMNLSDVITAIEGMDQTQLSRHYDWVLGQKAAAVLATTRARCALVLDAITTESDKRSALPTGA